MSSEIIDFAQWFRSPAGRYLHAWELEHGDQVVADCFGYHALQIGCEYLQLLRNSRIQHRWLAGVEACWQDEPATLTPQEVQAAGVPQPQPDLILDPTALPFAENSVDLVVLPHTLEASADPHATLREVARVLVPEGRLLVIGFNPTSLWGAQQHYSMLAHRMGGRLEPFIPDVDDLIGHRRLRDWLRLLNLEVEGGRFGCYRPGMDSARWFGRLEWMERAVDRWWPVLGGVYLLTAVKRVRGMRMLQPRWKEIKRQRSQVPVAQQAGPSRRRV